MSRPALASRPPATEPDGPSALVVELVQNARIRLDVARLDLVACEERLGLRHDTTLHFRQALAEARREWDVLLARLGTRRLDEALAQPPRAVVVLPASRPLTLVPIGGATYHAEPLAPTRLAPRLWRLTRLEARTLDDPYYLARRADGLLQCDCAAWTFAEELSTPPTCKHLAALVHLGWL